MSGRPQSCAPPQAQRGRFCRPAPAHLATAPPLQLVDQGAALEVLLVRGILSVFRDRPGAARQKESDDACILFNSNAHYEKSAVRRAV